MTTPAALRELADRWNEERTRLLRLAFELRANGDATSEDFTRSYKLEDKAEVLHECMQELRTAASEGGEERDGCDDSVVGMQTNIAIVRNVLNGKRYGEDENASREMALELLEWIGQHAIAAEMTPTGTGASEGEAEMLPAGSKAAATVAHVIDQMIQHENEFGWIPEWIERLQKVVRCDDGDTHPPEVARDATNPTEISSKLVDEKWPARFGCNGPEGSFWTDDAELAHRLIVGTFDRDEWTVTDTEHPYHTAISGAAGVSGDDEQ